MKNLSRLLFVLLLFIGLNNVNAQDENNPWQINFGFNAVDVYPTGEDAPLGDYFDEYFNVNDHWNIIPVLSYFELSRYMGGGFSLGLVGSLNSIDKFGDAEIENVSYIAADAIINFNIGQVLGWGGLQPFVGVGGGYTWVDKIGAGTLNGTLGLNWWFSEQWGLVAQSTYKHSFEDEDVPKHFQHKLGVAFKFGGKDTDGDGIYDKDDACPEVPGLEAFNGCPDTDGDGIQDSEDQCPNEAGPSANNGCPWPDKDGDGVLDKDDECPDVPGTVANSGCPEISEAIRKSLNDYAKTILFETAKTDIRFESAEILSNIAAILKEYPRAKFYVDGHTDSVGREDSNQTLSEGRAQSVVDWLGENGIDKSRLTARGFGESQPLMDNSTKEGRYRNRRVEIILNRD